MNFPIQLGITFVTNQNDPVPTVPPLLFGFTHSAGEIHIVDGSQTNIVYCPGHDNKNCVTGNSPLHLSEQNHLGPYFDDITFDRAQCSSSHGRTWHRCILTAPSFGLYKHNYM
ncbi:hypothetical protein B0H19DRAFT_1253950 [Mycena capillaripes]|nr:hypothetical protein B0H19DRAFT_1253950 [Mycena capillaripes]